MFAAVIRLGEGLGGTHPAPTAVVFAETEFALEGKIDEMQWRRAEIANKSAMDHWRKMMSSAAWHGEPEPARPILFQSADFPVVWRGDPDDPALDPAFCARLAREIQHGGI